MCYGDPLPLCNLDKFDFTVSSATTSATIIDTLSVTVRTLIELIEVGNEKRLTTTPQQFGLLIEVDSLQYIDPNPRAILGRTDESIGIPTSPFFSIQSVVATFIWATASP